MFQNLLTYYKVKQVERSKSKTIYGRNLESELFTYIHNTAGEP